MTNNKHSEDRFLYAILTAQLLEYMLLVILKVYVKITQETLRKKGIHYDPKVREGLTYREYINRIESFYPNNEENKKFYSLLTKAIDSRNKFIHRSFIKMGSKLEKIKIDLANLHLDQNLISTTNNWIKDCFKFFDEAYKLLDNLLKQLKQI